MANQYLVLENSTPSFKPDHLISIIRIIILNGRLSKKV